ncbi:light-regulated protein, chloroplastic-like [Nymphaea colorata]|nr:light-regulated protein, chloroplastic-like [Nymphaea colorata]
MQVALSLSTSISITRNKNSLPCSTAKPRKNAILLRPRITAAAAESVSVDYSSATSVFPAEACDVVGGEACAANMYPEVKPREEMASSRGRQNAMEEVDREYLEYNEPTTVFPDEACDDLGGEFCEAEYQKGGRR